MLSRKHYIEIADCLDIVRAGTAHHPALSGPQRAAGTAALERAATTLARYFREDSPRFDTARFLERAGF